MSTIISTVLTIAFFIYFIHFLNTTYKIENNILIIKFAFSKVSIPLNEISEVTESKNYGYEKNTSYFIGSARQPDRLLISVGTKSYFIALNGSKKLAEKIKNVNPNIKINGVMI